MKKVIISGILSLFISPIQAKLPNMCFDGTYAGGGECELIVNGEKVGAGLEPDEFYQDEAMVTEELSEIFKDLHDKLIPDKKSK